MDEHEETFSVPIRDRGMCKRAVFVERAGYIVCLFSASPLTYLLQMAAQ